MRSPRRTPGRVGGAGSRRGSGKPFGDGLVRSNRVPAGSGAVRTEQTADVLQFRFVDSLTATFFPFLDTDFEDASSRDAAPQEVDESGLSVLAENLGLGAERIGWRGNEWQRMFPDEKGGEQREA